MPRPPRYPVTGIPLYVSQRGNNSEPTFFQNEDYDHYLSCMSDAANVHKCDIHAYVLLPNHTHLLVTPHHPGGVAKLMQSIGRCYVHYINDTYNRSGTLWGGRYKACLLDPDRYPLICYRYIESLPRHAKLVANLKDYPWSSYHRNALGKKDRTITDHPLYLNLGKTSQSRRAAYRNLVKTELDDQTMAEIEQTLHQCRVLGSNRFIDEIESTLERRVRPRKRGRPKKAAQIL